MKDYELDNTIKNYYKKGPNLPAQGDNCPSGNDLIAYAMKTADEFAEQDVGAHVGVCTACSELVTDIRLYDRCKHLVVKERISMKALNRAKMLNPRCGKERGYMNNLKKNVWLIISLAALAASFFVCRYFLQLLIVSVIFGVKWIFDTGSTKTLIMVHNAWKRHDDAGHREIDHLLRR